MRKLIGTIAILFIIVAGIGYYRGWFSITKTEEPGGDRVNVGLSLDKSRAGRDVAEAGDKLQEIADRGKQEIERRTSEATTPADEKAAGDQERVAGRIVGVDPAGKITVQTSEGASLPVDVPEAADVKVDGRDADAAALRTGDQVVVHYRVDQGKNVATDLDVTTRPS